MLNRGKWADKKCILCFKYKQRNEFPPSAWKRSDYRCTKCSNIRAEGWRKRNPERHRKNSIRGERKYLLKWYGATLEWFDNKMKEQDNRCAICGCYENSSSHRKRFDVDHCHNTGKLRGLLCNRCNTGIGQLKDNEQILTNAIAYLRKYSNENKDNH